jgi:hypothetical protein
VPNTSDDLRKAIELTRKHWAECHSAQHPSVGDGNLIEHHGPELCEGETCCFHNPSDHPLTRVPYGILYRGPRRNAIMVSRRCDHLLDHPDPDSMGWLQTHGYSEDADEFIRLHWEDCDGCCQVPVDPQAVDDAVESLLAIKRKTENTIPNG